MKKLLFIVAIAVVLGLLAYPARASVDAANVCTTNGYRTLAEWTPGAFTTLGPSVVVKNRRVTWTQGGFNVAFAFVEGSNGEQFYDSVSPAQAASPVVHVLLCGSR